MTGFQSVVRIILPQAVVISIPSMTNYFIWLLKGTSLASIINVSEMLITAQISAADGYQVEPSAIGVQESLNPISVSLYSILTNG